MLSPLAKKFKVVHIRNLSRGHQASLVVNGEVAVDQMRFSTGWRSFSCRNKTKSLWQSIFVAGIWKRFRLLFFRPLLQKVSKVFSKWQKQNEFDGNCWLLGLLNRCPCLNLKIAHRNWIHSRASTITQSFSVFDGRKGVNGFSTRETNSKHE